MIDKMKLNKEIINEEIPDYKIYCAGKANSLYMKGTHTHRQLSLMKQENIRYAIRNGYNKLDILLTMNELCGYCFKYMNANKDKDTRCYKCPIFKINKKQCYLLESKPLIKDNLTRQQLADKHEEWLKDIGLWLPKFEIRWEK